MHQSEKIVLLRTCDGKQDEVTPEFENLGYWLPRTVEVCITKHTITLHS